MTNFLYTIENGADFSLAWVAVLGKALQLLAQTLVRDTIPRLPSKEENTEDVSVCLPGA